MEWIGPSHGCQARAGRNPLPLVSLFACGWPARTGLSAAEAQGKLVIDLSNGDVWGFPIVFTTSNKPPVSKPTYLGKYDFSAMKRVP